MKQDPIGNQKDNEIFNIIGVDDQDIVKQLQEIEGVVAVNAMCMVVDGKLLKFAGSFNDGVANVAGLDLDKLINMMSVTEAAHEFCGVCRDYFGVEIPFEKVSVHKGILKDGK